MSQGPQKEPDWLVSLLEYGALFLKVVAVIFWILAGAMLWAWWAEDLQPLESEYGWAALCVIYFIAATFYFAKGLCCWYLDIDQIWVKLTLIEDRLIAQNGQLKKLDEKLDD